MRYCRLLPGPSLLHSSWFLLRTFIHVLVHRIIFFSPYLLSRQFRNCLMAHFLLILLISRISCSQGIWGYLIFFTFRRQIIFLQKLKEIFLCPFKCFFSWYFCQVNNIQFLLFFSRSPLPLATFQPLYPKKEEKKTKKRICDWKILEKAVANTGQIWMPLKTMKICCCW